MITVVDHNFLQKVSILFFLNPFTAQCQKSVTLTKNNLALKAAKLFLGRVVYEEQGAFKGKPVK